MKAVCDAVKPTRGIIPIHGRKPEDFDGLGLNIPVIALADGEVFQL